MGSFSEELSKATDEDKQVNHKYVQAIAKELPKIGANGHGAVNGIDTEVIIYPEIKTDGVYNCYYIDDSNGCKHNYLLQLECKLDVDFNDKEERAKVLLQVAAYLRQIKDKEVGYLGDWNSNSIPRVVVLGSKINCLALPASLLYVYAGRIVNAKAASTAYKEQANSLIISDILKDANIEVQSIVYNTADKDCVKSLCNEIAKLGRGLQITDDLSEATISKAFDFFDMYVLDTKFAKSLSSREKVSIFIGLFFSDEFEERKTRGASYYDKIFVNGIEIKIDPDYYNKFKLLYSTRDYSRLEQKQITAITDRLIEDTDRRRRGDFYTPTVWVDEAHKLLDKNLGENWRDEYMVWDCAWGTGNLTRDYSFADLYCSTLNQEELNIGARYNKNAVKFQYDFLNDDVEEFESIKTELKRPLMYKSGVNMDAMEQYINFAQILDLYCMAIEKGFMTQEDGQMAYSRAINILHSTKLYAMAPSLITGLLGGENGEDKKKLLFLINPPYATTGNIDMKGNKSAGLGYTKVNELMENIGGAKQQLYAQFIYRIQLIKQVFGVKCYMGLYCPTVIFTGKHFKQIRNGILNNGFINGFYFQASEFANVADDWAINFSLWSYNGLGGNTYKLPALSIQNAEDADDNVRIVHKVIDEKMLYSTEGHEVQKYIPANNCKETTDVLTMSSGLCITDKIYKQPINTLATLFMDTPRVGYNARFVTLINRRMKGNKIAISICEDNFSEAITVYAARKIITGKYANWTNNSDEYMIPNKENENYKQFEYDSIIYSLFNDINNITSLRNIEDACGKNNIFNEFFWMSVKDIRTIAENTAGADKVYDDLDMYGKERFVYKKLQTVTLSPDAQAVLDKATELVKSSFQYRAEFDRVHPEYHINTWDAGWYQIKGMLKQYDSEGLKQFNELYKKLEDRMRPLVYELGFLYK